MTQAATIQSLRILAIAGTVAVLAVLAWDHIHNRNPNAAAYQAASDAFDDGDWSRAAKLFSTITNTDAANLGARRGLANALVQMARFDAAYEAITRVVIAEPGNACNFAMRGIIEDHRGRHNAAIADYARAVANCPAATDGMSWLQRVISNTHERPPTIAERLDYLRAQMKLPHDQRVLRIPEYDRAQKPWKG